MELEDGILGDGLEAYMASALALMEARTRVLQFCFVRLLKVMVNGSCGYWWIMIEGVVLKRSYLWEVN